MGYEETVRRELSDWARVWGPEQNGGTSENILTHLNAWAITRTPDILHVNCGLHDLKKDLGKGAPAVALDRYADTVRSILSRLTSETGATIIWALTTPVNQNWHHKNKPFDRFETDVIIYNDVARNIAREMGIIVNDLFSVIISAGRDSLLLPDGVHFKPEGYILSSARVWQNASSGLPQMPNHTNLSVTF